MDAIKKRGVDGFSFAPEFEERFERMAQPLVPDKDNFKNGYSEIMDIIRREREEEKRRIQEELESGMTPDELAEKYRLSKRELKVRLKEYLNKDSKAKSGKRLTFDIEAVRSRYDNKCALCGFGIEGAPGGGNVAHHIIWKQHGGTEELDNMILVCPNCHMMIHKNIITPQQVRAATKKPKFKKTKPPKTA